MNWNTPNYLDEFYKRNSLMEHDKAEFMHNLLINKMCGFVNACIVELKVSKQFTHKDFTFTYYLN